MTQIIFGERIGKDARLMIGTSATIFDSNRQKVLLTRRADNGQWCLPGGRMEPGENIWEACQRETWEETGLHVRQVRLLGVYSSPDHIIQYTDGNRFQIIALNFEAEVISGKLTLNEEVTEFGYFGPDEFAALDLIAHHRERLADAFAPQGSPFLR